MECRIQHFLMTPSSQLTVFIRGERYHITFNSSRFVGWSLPATGAVELSDFDFKAQARRHGESMLVGTQLSGSCELCSGRGCAGLPNKSFGHVASKPTAISTFMLP